MTPEAIFKRLEGEFGQDAVFDFHGDPKKDKDPWFRVAHDRLEEVCNRLRASVELSFDYLECITGVDYPEDQKIVVVYHLYSYAKKHRVVLKASLDRDRPEVASLVNLWSTANWQERECFDLLGVQFLGHPNQRRLLLPDDWEGHPLRKDYREKDDYHGIPTVRPNPIDLLKISLPPKDKDIAKA
jgi:NADH-quinone oxidoreductase subunit C